MKKYKCSAFIFRRDFRLDDNKGLLKALANSKEVIPVFIFNPEQIGKCNEYRSNNCVQFMVECLMDLDDSLKEKGTQLYFFENSLQNVLNKISKKADAIYVNEDYTPFSKKRDQEMKEIAKNLKMEYNSYEDLLLLPVETILSNSGKPYTIFTHFGNKVAKETIPDPVKNEFTNYFKGKLDGTLGVQKLTEYFVENKNIFKHGGRKEGLEILKNISSFKTYSETRNFPCQPTTGLSAFNKFGPISIREVYHACCKALGKNHEIVKQLIWRDFFSMIMHYNPDNVGHAMNKAYEDLPWLYDKENFQKWCDGKTGFPLVDAGMRELNETGFMHNRPRMVVANFLTKDLIMDWKLGEKYFAQNLIDYDVCVNNGNWQWSAGTGTDPEKYGGPRIFNPWLQSKKYDPDAIYIKKWIPELEIVPPKDIHLWYKHYSAHKSIKYPKPIVEHATQRDKCLKMFKIAKRPKFDGK